MRDNPAVLRARYRRPTAHLRCEPRLFQINSRLASEIVLPAFFRHVLFMRAPSHFRRLASFGIKTVHGPRVDELIHLLRFLGRLRIALGDVDDFNLKFLRERRPFLARFWLHDFLAGIFCDSQKRLLNEVGNEAGICAVRDNCRRAWPRDR